MKRYTYLIPYPTNICWYSKDIRGIQSQWVTGLLYSDKNNISAMHAAYWVYDWEEKKYLKNRYYPSATSPPDIKQLETMYQTNFLGDENICSQTLVLWEIEDSR